MGRDQQYSRNNASVLNSIRSLFTSLFWICKQNALTDATIKEVINISAAIFQKVASETPFTEVVKDLHKIFETSTIKVCSPVFSL